MTTSDNSVMVPVSSRVLPSVFYLPALPAPFSLLSFSFSLNLYFFPPELPLHLSAHRRRHRKCTALRCTCAGCWHSLRAIPLSPGSLTCHSRSIRLPRNNQITIWDSSLQNHLSSFLTLSRVSVIKDGVVGGELSSLEFLQTIHGYPKS